MPTIASDDGQTLAVSVDDYHTIHRLLEHLGAGRLRSLVELANGLLTGECEFEDRTKPDPAPPGSERLYKISCPARITAKCYGQREPSCRWIRDGAAYTCRECAGTVGPGMARHSAIARQFGDIGVDEAPAGLRRWWVRTFVDLPTPIPGGGRWWVLGFTSEATPRLIMHGLVDAGSEIEARAQAVVELGAGSEIVDAESRPRDWTPSGRYS